MTLPPRAHNKETTSVRTKDVDLKKEKRQSAESAVKTPVPKRPDNLSRATGALSTGKRPIATGSVPAKKKVVQATPPPASLPRPTTQRSQMLKASNFKSEPRWDFEEDYTLDVGSLQKVSLDLRCDSAHTTNPSSPFLLCSP